MPIISGGQVMPGYTGTTSAGAPAAGTDEVQTITIGGTPTGGTFRLSFAGFTTAPISWSATNTTLRDNVDAALEALPNIGTDGVTVAVGTMTSGVGTLTVTFDGANVAKRAQPTMTANASALTGTDPTVTVAETTAGVNATGFGVPTGGTVTDVTNGVLYINTGTEAAPTWAVVGSQS